MALNAQFYPVPFSDLTEKANEGTAETILGSMTLPPHIFRELGDGIRITAAFAYALNANLKTVKLYFGSSTDTVNGRAAPDNGSFVIIQALIINKGSFQRSISTLFSGIDGFAINMIRAYTEVISGPIRIRIAGQSDTASGDITSRILKVEYIPAGNGFPI